jgi:hypothetical protein
LNFSSHHVWWDESVPVGESFLWKIEPGEPPPAPKGTTEIIGARLTVEALPGTATYLRLKRTMTEGFKPCAETAETVRMCHYTAIESEFEIVPPDEAQLELAGSRRTIYGKAEQ